MQFDRLNEKSNQKIVELYFDYIGETNIVRALEAFSNKLGFGILDVGCEFACNFDEWEEGYFGDSGVEVLISAPLVATDFSRVVSEIELLEGAKMAIAKFELSYDKIANLIEKITDNFSE